VACNQLGAMFVQHLQQSEWHQAGPPATRAI
jgi:hypothetical protein